MEVPMKIMYDPYSNTHAVGDAFIEGYYLNNLHRIDWVWTSQHEVIHRAQLGLLRGEIDSLTLRIFDHDEEKAYVFEANQYGDFTEDWYRLIHDHAMEWTVERSKLSRELRLVHKKLERLQKGQ
jgi:hypothetical protein